MSCVRCNCTAVTWERNAPYRTEHNPVHHQFASGTGTSDQRTGAARVLTVVDVATVSRCGYERLHLAVKPIEQICINHVVDNGVAVLLNVRGDVGGRSVRRKMVEAHGSDTRKCG